MTFGYLSYVTSDKGYLALSDLSNIVLRLVRNGDLILVKPGYIASARLLADKED
mgnify:CR=1 FL=1